MNRLIIKSAEQLLYASIFSYRITKSIYHDVNTIIFEIKFPN